MKGSVSACLLITLPSGRAMDLSWDFILLQFCRDVSVLCFGQCCSPPWDAGAHQREMDWLGAKRSKLSWGSPSGRGPNSAVKTNAEASEPGSGIFQCWYSGASVQVQPLTKGNQVRLTLKGQGMRQQVPVKKEYGCAGPRPAAEAQVTAPSQ